MKGIDIYRSALSLIGERVQRDGLYDLALNWLNTLLAEALPYENNLRRTQAEEQGGLPQLNAAPRLTDWQQETDYRARLCDPALVYGLASFIAQYDDNEYLAQSYRRRYLAALYDAQRYEPRLLPDAAEVSADV